MATTAKEVTWLYRQLGIPVQFNISYKMQLTRFWLSGDKNLSPRTGERHLLHSLVFLFASTGQDFKLSNTRATERTVCTWVMSKLTYWYIRDVSSVASRAKGYQALPLLTVRRYCAGGEPGNEATVKDRTVHWFLLWEFQCEFALSTQERLFLLRPGNEATRGGHIHVACRSVCDQDQESWSVKIVLDRLMHYAQELLPSIPSFYTITCSTSGDCKLIHNLYVKFVGETWIAAGKIILWTLIVWAYLLLLCSEALPFFLLLIDLSKASALAKFAFKSRTKVIIMHSCVTVLA